MAQKLKKRPVVFVLIDGIGDVSASSLNDKTAIEQARTPAMDAVAFSGVNGLMDPVEPGFGCGSDTAHMSILGYDPFIHYRGRGSFEAMGAGLPMDKGDVAFKCNFATVKPNDQGELIVERRRVDRNFPQWGIELCSFLDGIPIPRFPQVHIACKYATEHRCGVVFKGSGLCDRMSGTDPLKDHLPLVVSEPLDSSKEAAYSSQVLNEVSSVFHKELTSHPINQARVESQKPPANIVLLRGPGERINVPSFEQVHRMKAFMIAPTCIIAGLGMSLDIDLVKVEGATGDYHTNLLAKGQKALELLQTQQYDFGFVHVKAVDDAGHDQDLDKKIYFIEKADEMLALVLEGITSKLDPAQQEVTVVVTGDHTTPALYGDHSFEPVPIAISRARAAFERLQTTTTNNTSISGVSPSALKDQVEFFSEIAAARGALGRFSGDQVMPILQTYRSFE